MNELMNTLFGPLDKDYCLYFYYLSIFGFIFLTLSFLTMVRLAVTRKRGATFYVNSLMVLLGYGIFYFQNRLLHSMCSNSL